MLIQGVLSSLLIGLCSAAGRAIDGQCESALVLPLSEHGDVSRPGSALIQLQKAAATPAAQKKKNLAEDASSATRASGSCDPPESEPSTLTAVGENASLLAYSSLHDVVGSDGVVMLSLDSVSTRSAFAAYQLNRIGIRPMKFSATDGTCASSKALARGCAHQDDTASGCQNDTRAGLGCVSRVEQAISDSHRRALEYAYTRGDHKWTAILEDDAVPANQDGYDWNMAFSQAWSMLPEGVRVVRLSWCTHPDFHPPHEPPLEDGQFAFKRSWDVLSLGGCTTAYMVHQSIIPEMLKIFPCCGAVDACLALDFFLKPDSSGKPHMDSVLWNLDAQNSSSWMAHQHISKWGNHFGVMMQNTDDFLSTRSGA